MQDIDAIQEHWEAILLKLSRLFHGYQMMESHKFEKGLKFKKNETEW